MSVASVSGRLRVERQAASGLPLLNSYRIREWRMKLFQDFRILATRDMTKADVYAAWRKAHAGSNPVRTEGAEAAANGAAKR